MQSQTSQTQFVARSAVLVGKREFSFEENQVPLPVGHQVLVHVKRVGICGSDVHYFSHLKCGTFETKGNPLILGHESAGIVKMCGEKVTHLKPGDRVALEPGIPCRMCWECKIGRYNLCQDVRFLATPPFHGSLSSYILHDEDFCFKLPDSVTMEEGALLEPLSVALHAIHRLKISAGESVLIMGAGPVGFVCLMAVKACGASSVIIADIKEDRLEKAVKEFGANHALRADEPQFLQRLSQLTKNNPIECAIECSGSDQAIKLAIGATARGGKIALIGRSAKETQAIPLFEAADKEVDLYEIFRYANAYPRALSLLSSGQLPKMQSLITHHFPLEKIHEAFCLAESAQDGALKVMLDL